MLRSTGVSVLALLVAGSAAAQAEPKNITYEFRFLSETERLADGTVEVVPVTQKDIFATLVLTHDAVKDREATVVFDNAVVPPTLPTNEDKGVVSFNVNAPKVLTFNVPGIFDYPKIPGVTAGRINMDLEIHGGELGGSIQTEVAIGASHGCTLTMQGTDGNWSGQWQCQFSGEPPQNQEVFGPLVSFTAIPFRQHSEEVAGR